MQPPEQPKDVERSNWVVVAVMIAAVGSSCLVVLPIGVYGFRNYVTRARLAETRATMRALAGGIADCASRPAPGRAAGLPPTTLPVPLALASVSGRKYRSAPTDWQDEAYRCAHFALAAPQPAQLQWIRASETAGYVRAALDVDGDMTPEWIVEQSVQCGADGQCALGEMNDRR